MRSITIPKGAGWQSATNPQLKDIRGYFFALLMRDPLARLISAYEDVKDSRFIRRGLERFPECSSDVLLNRTPSKRNCTFERFVEAVKKAGIDSGSNIHYASQVALTRPEHMQCVVSVRRLTTLRSLNRVVCASGMTS